MKERDLLKSVKHMALATVNKDLSPHNTPLFFAIDYEFGRLYFVSRDDSLHSVNLLRSGQGFAVIYNSNSFEGGIYIHLENARRAEGAEKERAFEVYDRACRHWEVDVLPNDYHTKEGGYNLYICDIQKLEAYSSKENSDGKLESESRKQITLKDLKV